MAPRRGATGKPRAQALGHRQKESEALKGWHNLRRPFRAHHAPPPALPGLAPRAFLLRRCAARRCLNLRSRDAFCWIFAAVFLLGLALRGARLDVRPMHHDEANQALKFATLLETGEYRYDPRDHHGPLLYYLTLPGAWARGRRNLEALDEKTLRAVPAVFGCGTIALLLLMIPGLSRAAVALGGLLAALSPALTYYSRFYIQEALLAFFILGFVLFLGRYALQPSAIRALAAGAFAGLACATKETAFILLACAAAALMLGSIRVQSWAGVPPIRPLHMLWAGAAAMIPIALLYSSFLAEPAGIARLAGSLGNYARTALHPELHAHPWYYYLALLGFSARGGLWWTEGWILGLVPVGVALSFMRVCAPGRERFWSRYLALYSVLAAAAFSLLPYKTPWNLISFHVGFAVVAGNGAVLLLKIARPRILKGAVVLLLLAGSVHLALQNRRANFVHPADARNPYAYAQTMPDFLRLVRRVHELAAVHPEKQGMPVRVVAGPYEQWPLPWYLRDLAHVGYWADASQAGGFDGFPVVIASQENASVLEGALGMEAQSEIYGLREGVFLTLFVERDLWRQYLELHRGR